MLYDIYGRRRPLAFSYLMTSLGLFTLTQGHSIYPWYIIARFFAVFENITAAVPFIPDLLKEESHGVANSIKVMMIALADFCGTLMLGLSSFKLFEDIYIFYFVLVLNIFVAVLIIFGMKDVILEKESENRRSINYTPKMTRAKSICSQACFLLKTEPYFIFAILGGMYSIVTTAIGVNNTIIAIGDALRLQGNENWEAESKWFFCKLKLT